MDFTPDLKEQRGTKEKECKSNGNPKGTDMDATWEGKAMKEQRDYKEKECKHNGNPNETMHTPWSAHRVDLGKIQLRPRCSSIAFPSHGVSIVSLGFPLCLHSFSL